MMMGSARSYADIIQADMDADPPNDPEDYLDRISKVDPSAYATLEDGVVRFHLEDGSTFVVVWGDSKVTH